jgi:hypothetical protein
LRKAYENAAVVGSSMIVVDVIDERAADFYRAHGFLRLPESMRLILPMRTILLGVGRGSRSRKTEDAEEMRGLFALLVVRRMWIFFCDSADGSCGVFSAGCGAAAL